MRPSLNLLRLINRMGWKFYQNSITWPLLVTAVFLVKCLSTARPNLQSLYQTYLTYAFRNRLYLANGKLLWSGLYTKGKVPAISLKTIGLSQNLNPFRKFFKSVLSKQIRNYFGLNLFVEEQFEFREKEIVWACIDVNRRRMAWRSREANWISCGFHWHEKSIRHGLSPNSLREDISLIWAYVQTHLLPTTYLIDRLLFAWIEQNLKLSPSYSVFHRDRSLAHCFFLYPLMTSVV